MYKDSIASQIDREQYVRPDAPYNNEAAPPAVEQTRLGIELASINKQLAQVSGLLQAILRRL